MLVQNAWARQGKQLTGGRLNIKMLSYQYWDPLSKIRRSRDCLIFNMRIFITGKSAPILRRGPGNWFIFNIQNITTSITTGPVALLGPCLGAVEYVWVCVKASITLPQHYKPHEDVIKWKHFPRYWPFVRGIHRYPMNSPKGQWRGALMFSLICARINGWVNNGEAGDLRCHRANYDVIVMNKNSMDVLITKTLSLAVLSPRNYTFVMTVKLPCRIQIFLVISSIEFRWEGKVISSNLKCDGKPVSEMGPCLRAIELGVNASITPTGS